MNAGLTSAQGSVAKFGAGTSAAMLGAGAAIAGLAVVSIKAASDLGESMNKARVIFGDSSDEVVKFSETTAESMGIAQSAALEAAGGFGAMFDSAGLAEKAAADMSIEMVTLAADMASFNNQDPSEMLERLRSGLAGEAEPLRKFGVFISEARVQTEAYASGIARAGEELTDAQKVQARFNIIMQDTAKQQGDFARTVGTSLPNQIRKLTAELTDLAAKIGKELLPVAIELLEVLLDIVEAAEVIISPVTKTGQAIEDLGGDFGTMDDQVVESFKSLFGFNDVALKTDFAARAAGGAIKEMERTVTLADGSVKTFTDVLIQGEDGVFRFSHTIGDASNVLDDFQAATVRAGHSGRIFTKDLREALTEELPAIVGTVVKYKEAFSLSPGEMRRIADTWAEIGRTMAHDLRVILNSDLTPTMKAGIAALPPEMRHAWVEGNRAQRTAIAASLKDTYNLESVIDDLVNDARSGGAEVGGAMMGGIRLGITTRSELISIEAANAVHRAIEAARNAAQAKSPSKEMMKLGRDLIEGLRLGLDEGPIVEQMEAIVRSMIDNLRSVLPAWRKIVTDLEDQLSRLQGRMGDLRSAISGGFGGFLDISGAFEEGAPGAGAFIQEQLAGAQQFASVLKALQSRNVSPALLGEIAGAGPEAIPFAQQLLQMPPSELRATNKAYADIADIAQKSARTLSEAYFGDRIRDVRGDLHDQRQQLRFIELRLEQLRAATVEQKGGDIILQIDGKEFARVAREALNRDGARNGGRTLSRTT